jgi:hypothetical protein
MTEPTTPTDGNVESKRFQIRDSQRLVTFTGECLGESTSQSGTDVRWTELSLYKTDSGRYLVERVGRSDVFHTKSCARRSKGELKQHLSDNVPEDRELEDYVPCDECKPSRIDSPVYVERDIFAVNIYATALELFQSLYRVGSNGIPFLSHVAQVLLEKAMQNDDDIRQIMCTPIEIS